MFLRTLLVFMISLNMTIYPVYADSLWAPNGSDQVVDLSQNLLSGIYTLNKRTSWDETAQMFRQHFKKSEFLTAMFEIFPWQSEDDKRFYKELETKIISSNLEVEFDRKNKKITLKEGEKELTISKDKDGTLFINSKKMEFDFTKYSNAKDFFTYYDRFLQGLLKDRMSLLSIIIPQAHAVLFLGLGAGALVFSAAYSYATYFGDHKTNLGKNIDTCFSSIDRMGEQKKYEQEKLLYEKQKQQREVEDQKLEVLQKWVDKNCRETKDLGFDPFRWKLSRCVEEAAQKLLAQKESKCQLSYEDDKVLDAIRSVGSKFLDRDESAGYFFDDRRHAPSVNQK